MHVSRAYAARVAQRLFLRQDMRHLILTQKGRLFFKGIDHRLYALCIHLVKKLDLLRDADAIFREELHLAGLDREINQYFAVLTNMRSVGVMGDGRTYDYTIALRGVVTSDFMTAEWARIPYEVLDKVSRRIVNEVKHVNRIVYDITSKPPATIEWE